MSDDDYLWDKSGPPDPEIVALERALAGVDADPPRIELPRPRARAIARVALPLAAALVLVAAALWWTREPAPDGARSDAIATAVQATPETDTAPSAPAPPAPTWIETDARSTKTIEIADLGTVELGPRTRLRRLDGAGDEQRYELARGSIHATVTAPPRVFVVETPSAVAVDLGCQYTLDVDDDGNGRLEVSVGFVAFERDGRECIVPAGASCETRTDGGVGTTVRLDAPQTLREAVRALDFGAQDPAARGGALAVVLREAGREDAVTLWHLLRHAPEPERGPIYDRFAALWPPPPGVTREGAVAGDLGMLRGWWDDMRPGQKGFRSPAQRGVVVPTGPAKKQRTGP
jgi:hypothetical protein